MYTINIVVTNKYIAFLFFDQQNINFKYILLSKRDKMFVIKNISHFPMKKVDKYTHARARAHDTCIILCTCIKTENRDCVQTVQLSTADFQLNK